MADFCSKCSDKPEIDILGIFNNLQREHGEGVLCEGCGLMQIARNYHDRCVVLFSEYSPILSRRNKWFYYDLLDNKVLDQIEAEPIHIITKAEWLEQFGTLLPKIRPFIYQNFSRSQYDRLFHLHLKGDMRRLFIAINYIWYSAPDNFNESNETIMDNGWRDFVHLLEEINNHYETIIQNN